MSLLEILGELIEPGTVGDIGSHDQTRKRSRLSAILSGIPCILLVGLPPGAMLANGWQDNPDLALHLFGIILLELVYLLVAYHVKPQPDETNLGLLGGLIDHPFKISDDFNRYLIFSIILLLPGRLLAIGVVDFVKAVRP